MDPLFPEPEILIIVYSTHTKVGKKYASGSTCNHQLIRDLFNQPEIGRRLNRMWPEDLIR
jgi:hypothetical protein